MRTVAQIKEAMALAAERVEAIVEVATKESRELTAEEKAEVDKLTGDEQKKLEEDLDRAEKVESIMRAKASQRGSQMIEAQKPKITFARGPVPKGFASHEDAYNSGQFILATLFGNKKARNYCREHGLVRNAMSTGDNTKGGFLVPEPMENAIVVLREQYGVFRRNMVQWPLPISGKMTVPKLTGELTAYFVGENTAPTASDVSLGQVQIDAKKLAILCGPISSEVNEDSAVAIAGILAGSIAQSMAIKEDDCGFNGDGTSTYGGILGLKTALATLSKATAATGHDTIAELTLADYHAVKAKAKVYPGAQNKWYVNSAVYYASMEQLQIAAGGNTVGNIAMGGEPMFLGAPVEFAQVLPSTDAASQIVAYYGDLNLACKMGTRRGMTIKQSDQVYFTSDALAVMATERFDIVVHDGVSSTYQGSNAAGAVIALVTAS
jgi:HK97 family phage major capsid protein